MFSFPIEKIFPNIHYKDSATTCTIGNNYFFNFFGLSKTGSGESFPSELEGDWSNNPGDSWASVITVTDTAIQFGLMRGTVPLFTGEIVKVQDDGATGYFVFRYVMVDSGMGLPKTLIGTYTVLYWESHDDDSLDMAIAGGNAGWSLFAAGENSPEAAEAAYIDTGYSFEFETFGRE